MINAFNAHITVDLSTSLRRFAGQSSQIEIHAGTVGAALAELVSLHPRLQTQLFDAAGTLRSFINVFVNADDIRYLQKDQTPLRDRDVMTILTAIAGG